MVKCTRRIEFDAAHRVIGHKNKCQFLHGHRYVLEVTAQSSELDNLGMVMDFAEMKKIISEWINNNLDHTLILHIKDKPLGDYIAGYTGQNIYYLDQNPTAENIALHLKVAIIPKLFINNTIEIIKIKLYETPNCFVEV